MAHSHSILKNFDILIGFMWVRSHNNCSSMRSVKNSRSLSSVMVHVILPFRVQALIAYIHINTSFIIQARRMRHSARCAKRLQLKQLELKWTTTATAVKTSLKKMNLTPPAPPRRFSRVGDVIKNCALNISRFVLNALSYDFFYRLYP